MNESGTSSAARWTEFKDRSRHAAFALPPHWVRRGSAVLVVPFVLASLVLVASPARAGGGHMDESEVSAVLVLQAISVITNDGTAEAAAEKLNDALQAPDQEGTDLAKVKQALALVEGSATSSDSGTDLSRARKILVSAIAARAATGYGEMPAPGVVGKDVSPYASGADTGTIDVLNGFEPARGVHDGGDVVLLVLSVLMVAAGLVLSRTWRPHDTIRELRSRSAAMRSS